MRKGYTAPQGAGVIHTDFEQGFICAEVSLSLFLSHFLSLSLSRTHTCTRTQSVIHTDIEQGFICSEWCVYVCVCVCMYVHVHVE